MGEAGVLHKGELWVVKLVGATRSKPQEAYWKLDWKPLLMSRSLTERLQGPDDQGPWWEHPSSRLSMFSLL